MHEPARIDVKDAGVDFTISYDPARQTGGAGHTSYDRALSLTENPIYTALENKRRRGQLRGAPEAALRMIVLCDAGCASMRDLMNPGTTHDADAIAMRFLQSTSSIDLVVLVTVERTAPYAVRSDLRLKVTPIGSPQAVAAGRLPKAVIDAVNHFLKTLCAHMPHPVQDASNAYRQFDQPGYGLGAHGGYTVSHNRIRVSSRELLEHLALWQCKDQNPVDRAREGGQRHCDNCIAGRTLDQVGRGDRWGRYRRRLRRDPLYRPRSSNLTLRESQIVVEAAQRRGVCAASYARGHWLGLS